MASVLLLAAARPAPAGAQRANATVLLCDAPETEVLSRVRGQVEDLQVTLLTVVLDAAAREQQAVFARLDAEHAAALVCIEGGADAGYVVRIYSSADRSMRERSVAASRPDDELSASAAREAVAMVVRSEVTQLLAQQHAPAAPPPQTTTAPAAPPTSAASPMPPSAATPASDASTPPAALLPLRLSAGWEAALTTGSVTHAFALRAGVELGVLELGVDGTFGLPVTLTSAQADARVARHGVRGSVMLGAALGSHFHAGLGGHLGLLVFQRSTRVRDGALTATADAATSCGSVGAQAVLRARLLPQVGLELRVLVDVVPAAPRFVVNSGTSSRVIAQARVLQPALGLGLFAAF